MDIKSTLKRLEPTGTNTLPTQWCVDIRAVGTREECESAFSRIKELASNTPLNGDHGHVAFKSMGDILREALPKE